MYNKSKGLRKIINDPVHGFITIEDEWIYKLISHPFYQRLRRIKQMALAYLVYPGAVHTRLHHSLGAFHLMHQAIQELKSKEISITKEEEQGAKIAILLHDIGHGPFSHALERTLVDVHHEELSLFIMHLLNKEYHGKLQLAIDIFTGVYPKKFLHQLVSSQLDVDRLDYLARDSFFTGVSEGVVGYDRILKMLTVQKDELMVEEKGIHSIEKFLIARRLMYSQVYLHKTVLSSELMLVNILRRAKWLVQQGETLFATPFLSYFLAHAYNEKSFLEDEQCLHYFLALDDSDIVSAIKVWANHDDKILSDICQRLVNRSLFKVHFLEKEDTDFRESVRQTILQSMPISLDELSYYYIEDTMHSNTYNENEEAIKIMFKSGKIKNISEVENSLIAEGLLVPIKKYLTFVF
jgi:HD superfamily phosphohydrolase